MRLLEKNSKIKGKIFPVGCFLIAVYCVIRYILFYSFAEMDSDTMDSLMWAWATYKSGGLLSPDFYYPCLLGAGGNIILLPFIALFGYSPIAYKSGIIFFFLLFISVLLFFLYAIDISFEKRFIFTAVICIFTLASSVLRTFMWTHILYYNLGILLFLLGFACMCMYLKKNKKGWCIGFGIVLAVSAMNGFTEILLVALPLLSACVLIPFFDFNTPLFNKSNRKNYVIFLSGILSVILGKVIILVFYGNIISVGYDQHFAQFSEIGTWAEHIQMLIPLWMDMFGVSNTNNLTFFSLEGIKNIFALVIGAAVAVLPLAYTLFYNKVSEIRKRLIWGHWIITGVILFGVICGQLYSSNRRLVPCAFTSFIMTILFLDEIVSKIRMKNLFYIIYTAFTVLVLISMFGIHKNLDNINQQREIAKYLDKQDYEYGYAPYFDANTIMLFSDKSRIIPISEVESQWRIFEYNTFKSWKEQATSQGGNFVIIKQSEYDALNDERRETLDMADQAVVLGNYYIFEYYNGLVLN